MPLQRNPNGSLLKLESGALADECCCDPAPVLACGYCVDGRTPQQLIVEFPPFDIINAACPGVADVYNSLVGGAAVLDHIGGGFDFIGPYCNYQFEESLGVTTAGLHPSNTRTYTCGATGCSAAASEKEFFDRRFVATLRQRFEAGAWRVRVTAGILYHFRYRACQTSGWGNWSTPRWDNIGYVQTAVEMGTVTNTNPTGTPLLNCDEINGQRKPGTPEMGGAVGPFAGVTQFGGMQSSSTLTAGASYSNTVTASAFVTAI